MNWYKTALIIAELEKEAGWKENLVTGILAAVIMVLGGSTIYNAMQKAKVSEEELKNALKNEQYTNKAKEIIKRNNTLETQQKQSSRMPSTNELFKFIKENEGLKDTVYYVDGIPHIGIGFNLNRIDAPKLIKNIGADYNAILSGKQSLTPDQIMGLFNIDLQTATNDARKFVSNFDLLPTNAKLVLIDMAYNMGYPRLSGFKKLKVALENSDFERAALEMKNSNWYGQAGNRSNNNVNIMRSI